MLILPLLILPLIDITVKSSHVRSHISCHNIVSQENGNEEIDGALSVTSYSTLSNYIQDQLQVSARSLTS